MPTQIETDLSLGCTFSVCEFANPVLLSMASVRKDDDGGGIGRFLEKKHYSSILSVIIHNLVQY